jgi:hypothetical protein
VLSPADFSMLKETVTQQKAEAEAQLSALDAETATMQSLLEETQNNIVDLVKARRTGNVQQRQELAFSLYPDGFGVQSRNSLLCTTERVVNAGDARNDKWSFGRMERWSTTRTDFEPVASPSTAPFAFSLTKGYQADQPRFSIHRGPNGRQPRRISPENMCPAQDPVPIMTTILGEPS